MFNQSAKPGKLIFRPETHLVFFLIASFLLVLPSVVLWWKSIQQPMLVTPFEYDYFLGLLGHDYGGQDMGTLMAGKVIHLLLLLLAGYAFVHLVRAAAEANHLRARIPIFPVSILAGVIYLSAVAWMSPDVYFYFGTGWLESHYRGNPYLHVIAQCQGFQTDPMFGNIIRAWHYIITPYGPLFVKLSALVAHFSSGNQVLALLLFKLCCALAHGMNAYLLWRLAKATGARAGAVLLAWTLNPVVLFVCLSANHNDVFLVLCILAAMLFAYHDQAWASVVALGIGVGVKYMPIFLLPLFLIYLTRQDPLPRAIKRSLQLLGLFGVVSLLPSLFYEAGLHNFLRLFKGQDQLLRNFLYIQTLNVIHSFRPVDLATVHHVKWFFKAVFVLLYAALWVHGVRQRRTFDFEALVRTCLLALLAYFLIGSPELHEWYLPWFLPFAFLSRDRRYYRFGMALSTCFLPFIIFEVRSPEPYYTLSRTAFFAVMWICAYLLIFRPRKAPGTSPLFERDAEPTPMAEPAEA